jgi:hypothetical protein
MTIRNTFFATCLIVSTLCLVAGYTIAEHWIGAVIALLAGSTWLLARKNPASGLPHICLMVSVGLAVAGQLNGSPSVLMICGSGFSLVVWDLLFLDTALKNNASGEQTKRYESKHLQSLALALASGLMAASLGRLLDLQIPFIVLVFFVALTVFGLDRIWSYFKKTSKHISQ